MLECLQNWKQRILWSAILLCSGVVIRGRRLPQCVVTVRLEGVGHGLALDNQALRDAVKGRHADTRVTLGHEAHRPPRGASVKRLLDHHATEQEVVPHETTIPTGHVSPLLRRPALAAASTEARP